MKMMKCGHSANAEEINPDGSKSPYCLICDCGEVADEPNLSGRMARCSCYGMIVGRKNETWYPQMMNGNRCGSIVPSSTDLPFFEYRPNFEFDKFYCGCQSWD